MIDGRSCKSRGIDLNKGVVRIHVAICVVIVIFPFIGFSLMYHPPLRLSLNTFQSDLLGILIILNKSEIQ